MNKQTVPDPIYLMPSFARYTEIVPASLENDAGLIGACYITLAKS